MVYTNMQLKTNGMQASNLSFQLEGTKESETTKILNLKKINVHGVSQGDDLDPAIIKYKSIFY